MTAVRPARQPKRRLDLQVPQPLPDTLPQPEPLEPPSPGPDAIPEIIEPSLPEEQSPIGDPGQPVPVQGRLH